MRKTKQAKRVICYLATSAGDYGGASRCLFVTLKGIDRKKYEPLLLFPSEGPIFEQLDRLGIYYSVWDKKEYTQPLAYVFKILRALNFLCSHKVDLLHINHTSYWRPAEIIAAKILRIPVVTHFHLINKNVSPYLKYSDLIIANSRFTAQSSVDANVPIEVVHNSVDLDRYDQADDIRKELGLGQDNVVVTFIGQVRETKGIDVFINLAKKIINENVKFVIVGRCHGPEKLKDSYTEDKIHHEIGHSGHITYLGYRSDIQNVYHSSDIIVMPSRWNEPFGLINIEAGAARKPIVSTEVGGIPEVIRHGENGFLVDKNDSEALMRYTTTLIYNQKLREKMGNKGREIVEKKFTERPIRKLEKIYEGLIKR
jgi:glycosyltransferase involved in cell wall biosynthesis